MRYLVASDLHYSLQQFDWIAGEATSFDAVVLGGDHLDIVGRAELGAQIVLLSALFGKIADRTTLFANSGNHDLDARRDHGEKAATWLDRIDPRVATDGHSRRVGPDLVSVCAWWEGPLTLADVEQQLAADAAERNDFESWIWVYHSPPSQSPTSWSGTRHFGDDVLNRLAAEYRPDIVLAGHVHEAPFIAEGSWHDRLGDTLFINAGRQSGPVPAHVIIDTGSRTASWSTSVTGETVAF
ncbi:MAG TPA: metallophosphoesterase [Ilumatobacter sp.]|nr:metallophosphoesterase [Ilumatobacter sp.]